MWSPWFQWAYQEVQAGATAAEELQRGISEQIQEAGGRVDYVEVGVLTSNVCSSVSHA